MKIGILTLPLHTNYGGIIQNYALQTFLKNMGHEVYTININRPNVKLNLIKAPFSITKRLINKFLYNKKGEIFIEKRINKEKKVIEQYVRVFINKNIQLTKVFLYKKELKEINYLNFDAIVVGSDQVWRPSYCYPDIETYFLDFVKNTKIKKIAYSVSFGNNEIEYSNSHKKKCAKLIEQFDFVSVREYEGLEIIKRNGWNCKNMPVCTVDPTLLLSQDEYIKLAKGFSDELNGDIFYYILDPSEFKDKLLNKITKELDYKAFTVHIHDIDKRIKPPLELWLQAFNKAKYVFTDSFHGCVFSIIFRKPFIVVANQERGISRFDSILKKFHLENRIIKSEEDYNYKLLNEIIDWNEIDKRINEEKELAIKIFKQLLS